MTSLLSISILCLALLILMNKAASWNTINGLAPILDKYDTFIIDQWGVVHDGKTPYHGALECLEYLKSKNKNLIMLSNSSKRRASSVKGLHKVGIDPKLWSEIITSGEVGWNLIEDKKVPLKLKKGSEDGNRKFKVFVIGNGEDDADYVASCNCVPSSEDVEFILARGTFSIFAERETKFDTAEGLIHHLLETSMLEKFAKAKTPMLVTNPDFNRPGSGSPMPGQISQLYSAVLRQVNGLEETDNLITSIGKPYSDVYNACFSFISQNLNGESSEQQNKPLDFRRVVMVGDSLSHDVLGAMNNKLDSIWIANGVHCNDMGTDEGSPVLPPDEMLAQMQAKYPHITPTYTTASFKLN